MKQTGIPKIISNDQRGFQKGCTPRHCHITPLLLDLYWLPVKERIQYEVLLFVFKALHGIAPGYITNRVELQSGSKFYLRSTNSRFFVKRKTKKTMGDRSFAVAARSLWNSLPPELRTILYLGSFKRQLKTHPLWLLQVLLKEILISL